MHHFNYVLDFANKIVISEDELGLVYLLFTPAEFATRFGHAPIIQVHLGLFAGSALEQRNVQVNLDTFTEQQMTTGYLIMEVHRVWPTDVKRLREDENDSLDYCPLHVHYTALQAALPVSQADVAAIQRAIGKPYARGDIIETFVKEQQNNIARLANNNHALNST